MTNDYINKLQSQGIKIERTKSRYDVFQMVFNKNSSLSAYISYRSIVDGKENSLIGKPSL